MSQTGGRSSGWQAQAVRKRSRLVMFETRETQSAPSSNQGVLGVDEFEKQEGFYMSSVAFAKEDAPTKVVRP
jgi:hypothetical protein